MELVGLDVNAALLGVTRAVERAFPRSLEATVISVESSTIAYVKIPQYPDWAIRCKGSLVVTAGDTVLVVMADGDVNKAWIVQKA